MLSAIKIIFLEAAVNFFRLIMKTRKLKELHRSKSIGTESSLNKMRIIELNIDCLEKIFENLSVADLLSLADSSKSLREVAEMVFKLKHSNKTLEIYGAHYQMKHIVNSEQTIEVYDLILSLKIIRCFGHLVKDLKIFVDRTDYRYKVFEGRLCHSFHFLITYVNQHCSESLTKFTLQTNREIPDRALNHLKRPFLNVEKLYIVQFSNLKRSLINKLFPKVQSLVYADAPYFTDFARIESHLPCLNHLHFNISAVKYRYTSTKCKNKSAQICSILRLNPQLVSLTIPFISDPSLFQCISQLPSLETLKLYNFWGPESNSNYETIRLKNLKKLKIDEFHECPKISLTFDHLEELRIFCHDFCINFYNFLMENPTIKKIKSSPNILRDEHLSKLASALLSLEQIDVRDLCITSSEVIGAIDNLKSLKKISFNFNVRSNEYDELQRDLNRQAFKDWKTFKRYNAHEGQWIECVRDMD